MASAPRSAMQFKDKSALPTQLKWGAPPQRVLPVETGMTVKPSTPPAETAFSFVVAPEEAGTRLDRYLAERAEIVAAHVSRTRIKALLEAGAATLNDRPARDGSAKLSEGDEVALRLPEPEAATPPGEDIPLNVVFEDEHLLVVDKPAGLVVHPAPGHESGTLVNALIAH